MSRPGKYQCTVITPLLDSDVIVRETYLSIEKQLNSQVCWLVKNSAEDLSGALDFLKHHPHIQYVERADSCLYDGINQALALADSDFYVVLGAGDQLAQNAVSVVSACIEQLTTLDALFFAARRYPKDKSFLPRPEYLNVTMSTPHPGAVLKVDKSLQIGGYDVRYRIAADYDHISRYTQAFPACGKNDFVLTHYLGGGLSEARVLEGFIETYLVRLRVWNETPASAALALRQLLDTSFDKLTVPL